MILTVRHSVKTTTATIAISTISAASTSDPLFEDERRSALDLGHLNLCAGLDHLVVEERAGAPDLAADLHLAAERVDSLEDERAAADERSGAGSDRSRRPQVAAGDGPQEQHRGDRGDDEDDDRRDDAEAQQRGERGEQGGDGEWPEDEAGRQHLTAGEERRDDQPDRPAGHSASIVLCLQAVTR